MRSANTPGSSTAGAAPPAPRLCAAPGAPRPDGGARAGRAPGAPASPGDDDDTARAPAAAAAGAGGEAGARLAAVRAMLEGLDPAEQRALGEQLLRGAGTGGRGAPAAAPDASSALAAGAPVTPGRIRPGARRAG